MPFGPLGARGVEGCQQRVPLTNSVSIRACQGAKPKVIKRSSSDPQVGHSSGWESDADDARARAACCARRSAAAASDPPCRRAAKAAARYSDSVSGAARVSSVNTSSEADRIRRARSSASMSLRGTRRRLPTCSSPSRPLSCHLYTVGRHSRQPHPNRGNVLPLVHGGTTYPEHDCRCLRAHVFTVDHQLCATVCKAGR